jgi:uroporphyrinogen decarboxylase
MYQEPEVWHSLMRILSELISDYLLAQVAAGAQAVQLFDSWVGALSPSDYVRYVQPHSTRVFENLAQAGVPRIHFGTNTATLLPLMKASGGDVIGVDWRVSLGEAWRELGTDVAIQGNLDPLLLFAPLDVMEREIDRILKEAGGRPGHIFNLGHGILPPTSVAKAKAVVDMVHRKTGGEAEGAEGV